MAAIEQGRPLMPLVFGTKAVGAALGTVAFAAFALDFGCRSGLWSNSIALSVMRPGYQDGSVPMGRGENFLGVIRQDVDIDPR